MSLESESEIEDFSAWVDEMGKPQVISLLLIFYFYYLWFMLVTSIRRLVEAQDTKLMDSSSAYQVLLKNEP